MNNDRHTVCPKCEFEWQELLVDDGEEYIPNHYCSAKAPLDNGEDSWVEDGEVKCKMSEAIATCSICTGDFDLDSEGGIDGDLGILPVAFCPTCLAGVTDMVYQLMGEE